MMDNETRFRIAQEAAYWKEEHDAGKLFTMGRELAGKVPKRLITDGLDSYKTAFEKEFALVNPSAVHVSGITLKGEIHNNKMELVNREVKDREKVRRGLKRVDAPILKRYQIYHNYVRPHEGLKRDTPAEKSRIKVKGSDKWNALIQNASRNG